jgi:hypothetical protein
MSSFGSIKPVGIFHSFLAAAGPVISCTTVYENKRVDVVVVVMAHETSSIRRLKSEKQSGNKRRNIK